MSILDSKERKKLPTSVFGLPAERKYPMPNKEHAILAKGRALEELKKGRLNKSQYKQIIAKAKKVME